MLNKIILYRWNRTIVLKVEHIFIQVEWNLIQKEQMFREVEQIHFYAGGMECYIEEKNYTRETIYFYTGGETNFYIGGTTYLYTDGTNSFL